MQSGLNILPFVQVTTLALQYPPEKLGIACLDFALQMMAQRSPPMVRPSRAHTHARTHTNNFVRPGSCILDMVCECISCICHFHARSFLG